MKSEETESIREWNETEVMLRANNGLELRRGTVNKSRRKRIMMNRGGVNMSGLAFE